jgi:hypothetical protein
MPESSERERCLVEQRMTALAHALTYYINSKCDCLNA